MKIFVILSLVSVCAMAAPGNYGTTSRANDAGIVNKVQQASEDGSYMFGYENGDGSFRMENRDANGLVRGKYGYIDANGERQEFEYTAGAVGDTALGFRSRNTQFPDVVGTALPAVRSTAQQLQDFAYSSLDADRDGFPDNSNNNGVIASRTSSVVIPQNTAEVVRFAPASSAVATSSPTVVRVLETPTVATAPVAIRTTTVPQQTEIVRQVTVPTQVEFQSVIQPTVIRQAFTGGQLDSFIRSIQPTTSVIRNFDTVQVVQGDVRGFATTY